MYKYAICIIAYNREKSLNRNLISLSKANYNSDVDLFVSIDKSNNPLVAEVANSFVWTHGNKTVIEHENNLGLRKHVLSCGDLLAKYDALIVLEDDVEVAESFFAYTKACVETYYNDMNIAGISLYSFPINSNIFTPFVPLHSDSDVYLMQIAQSWGQVWMKKQWRAFREWYDRNNLEFGEMPHLPKSICNWPKSSWLKYHTRYCIEEKKYFVYPYTALSTNNSDAGTHVSNRDTLFQSFMQYGRKCLYNLNPSVRYDAFFECENLYDAIGFTKKELCLDLSGYNKNSEKKRYWLTRERADYKILKSYSLEYKPIEFNILNGRDGNDIFLYDTSDKVKNPIKNNSFAYFCHTYQIRSLYSLFKRIVKLALYKSL